MTSVVDCAGSGAPSKEAVPPHPASQPQTAPCSHAANRTVPNTPHPQELFQLLWRVADGLDAAAHARSDTGDHAFYQLMDRFYREYGRHVMRSTPAFLVGTTLIRCVRACVGSCLHLRSSLFSSCLPTRACATGCMGRELSYVVFRVLPACQGRVQLAHCTPDMHVREATCRQSTWPQPTPQ